MLVNFFGVLLSVLSNLQNQKVLKSKKIEMTFLSHSTGTLNRPIARVEVPTAKSIVSRDRLEIETAICAKHTLDSMEIGD